MNSYFKRLENNNSLSQESKRYSNIYHETADLTLNFVFSGLQRYKINRQEFKVQPDCFLILNKGTVYESHILSDDYVHSCAISFDKKFIQDIHRNRITATKALLDLPEDDKNETLTFPETLLPLQSNLLFNLRHIKSFIANNLNDDFLLEEYLHHTFINYFEIYHQNIIQAEERLACLKQHTKAEIIKRLNLAKDYIYGNYNQPIALKDIATHSYLSVNHLLRTFKQAYGETPHQFLTGVRLKRAHYLVKNTTFSVNEIVSTVGFECPSSFIRLYKSHYHSTPAKNRKFS